MGGARKGQEKPGRATADALEVPDSLESAVRPWARGGRGGAKGCQKEMSTMGLLIPNSPLKIWAPPKWPNGMAQP